MWRNQYDQDCLTWSPEGRIHQIDYAMEAVKQGSISIALRSKTHAVVVALKRNPHEMAGHQEKVFRIDDHFGISISGLTADGRLICKYLRTECLNYKYVHDNAHPVQRLITKIAYKAQVKTQKHSKRPYGVGMLIIGYDKLGPHVFETSPNATYYEYFAYAIGAKAQSAKTYLEKHFEEFNDCSEKELMMHGLKALRSCENEIELTIKNVSLAIVGKDTDFTFVTPDDLQAYLGEIAPQGAEEGGDEDEVEMEIET